MKLKINGWAKLALTILFTIFFGVVAILGVMYDGSPFETVFPAMCLILWAMVKDLFTTADNKPPPP
jgi:hypothetical protein